MGKPMDFQLRLTGAHQAVNAAGVVAAALARASIRSWRVDALSELEPPDGAWLGLSRRSSRKTASSTVVDDSYNANPASMRAAFSALKLPANRTARAAAGGDRRNAGAGAGQPGDARRLAAPLAESGADQVIGVGRRRKGLAGRLAARVERALVRERRTEAESLTNCTGWRWETWC
jgi:UDP-N-acetylmuramoyl-tripeptide--D-alanyl-D-alanine ligase